MTTEERVAAELEQLNENIEGLTEAVTRLADIAQLVNLDVDYETEN